MSQCLRELAIFVVLGLWVIYCLWIARIAKKPGRQTDAKPEP